MSRDHRKLKRPLIAIVSVLLAVPVLAQEPKSANKPVLHGSHWMAITGKPLAATAGALTFDRGGNAVDAALRNARGDGNHVGFARLGR